MLTNIPAPGELAPVPDIEVNVVPVTGSAEGTIIVDASVPYLGIGILDEPIVCSVRNGYIVEMTGGAQADFLRRHLESFADPHCFNVAELGVGLNPNARLTGEMLEDEASWARSTSASGPAILWAARSLRRPTTTCSCGPRPSPSTAGWCSGKRR